jgi:hypothetical protein
MDKIFAIAVAMMLLAGCGGGGEAVPAEKPDTQFGTYVRGLGSDDTTARRKAFDYLAGQGEKGLDAIRDFCVRHTNDGWGKEENGLRCRISTEPILYYDESGKPVFKGSVVQGHINIELQNAGPDSLRIRTFDGGIVANPLHSTTIESYVGEKAKEYKAIREIPSPEKMVQIGSGKEISGRDSACDTRYYDWADDEVVCFRNYKNMAKGIYFITYRIHLFREKTGSQSIQSNRICFALLPVKKK